MGIAASANEAFELAKRSPPDLVLLDSGLADSVDGIELARRLQESFSLAHVYVTGHIEPEVIARANRTSPLGYVVKPFCDAELLTGIEIALCRSRRRCRAASDLGALALSSWTDIFRFFKRLELRGEYAGWNCNVHHISLRPVALTATRSRPRGRRRVMASGMTCCVVEEGLLPARVGAIGLRGGERESWCHR